MFVGSFYHTLDEKNRIVIPSKFRDFITDPVDQKGLFILEDPRRCLQLYTHSGWLNVVESLQTVASGSDHAIEDMRSFVSHAEFVPLDKQYRLVLPQKFIETIGLKRDIVLVGVIRWMEVWNVAEWNARPPEARPYDAMVRDVQVRMQKRPQK